MRGIRSCYSLGCAGLAEGTNANTFKTSNAIQYVIAGRSYYKAATDNLAFSSGTAMAAKKKAVFWVLIDAAGTVTTEQSTTYDGSQSASYVSRAIEPPLYADKACIGAIVIETHNAATFTPGSVDLSATDVVDTYANFADDYGVPVTI